MHTYGKKPTALGLYPIKCEEILFYQYLPIKLAGKIGITVPDRLQVFMPLILEAIKDYDDIFGKYIYITAKHLFVTPQYWGNRPGYHTDGFMTDDINYIWCDSNPTIINISDFDITEDHQLSMMQFEQQAKEENELTYPKFSLLKLDQYVVHKVAPVTESHFRTFVKISISKEKYNLKGNSHNYLLDYKWDMVERKPYRNHPIEK